MTKQQEEMNKRFDELKLITGAMWLVKMWEKYKHSTEIEIELPEHIKDEIKSFLHQEIERAVENREKEIVEKLNDAVKHTDNVEMKTFLYTDQILSLITNINK